MLCERLSEELSVLSVLLAKKEREELRKQRLKFVDISVSNILKKQNPRVQSRRKGSADYRANKDEVGEELMDGDDDQNAAEDDNQLLNDENEENIEHKPSRNRSHNRSRNRPKREDNEEDIDDEEDEDNSRSGADDDIGKALWSEEDSEGEETDKYAAIKSRRNRKRKNINYQFTEFDELIKSAIEQDVEYDEYDVSAAAVAVADGCVRLESKGKDMSNIIASNTEELDFSLTPKELKREELLAVDQKYLGIDVTKEDDLEVKEQISSGDKQLEESVEKKAVKEKSEEPDEEKEEEEEEVSDEEEEVNRKSKKRPNRRSSAATRKRHRGLNDLSDTSEGDDDSDEDFKGDDSATEVEEGSDEEFVDDGSTQEDEEVSDDSDFRYATRRRSSGRNSSRKSGKKGGSKGGQKAGARRKGYRRDAFVVSSDDSEEYRPGAAKKKTRSAARKRISYREETTTEEESEEEYYWNSSKNKSKSKAKSKSESSDDDWGGRGKSSKNKKSKDSSEEDEEEDEEEEDNEEDKDDNEEESEEEKDESKPGPKSSKQTTARPLTMKGKPRLSKARGLLNLKEDSDDDETEVAAKQTKKKRSRVVSDSDEDEEPDIKTSKSADKSKTGAQSADPIPTEEQSTQPNDQNFELKSKSIESLEKMLTNSGLTSDTSAQNKTKTIDNSSSDVLSVPGPPPLKTAPTVSHLLAQQLNSYPQMKGTHVTGPDVNSHKQNHSLGPNSNNIEEYYSMTSLDAYPPVGPPPLKPTAVADPYVQQSSPPRILTLDSGPPSGPYTRHPNMDYGPPPGYPMTGPLKGPHIDPRMERPMIGGHPLPPNVTGMSPFGAHQPNLRPELRHTHSGRPPLQSFGGIPQTAYYPSMPPTAGHPYYATRPQVRPHEPGVAYGAAPPPHGRHPTGPSIGGPPPRTTAPTTSSSMSRQGPPPNYRPVDGGAAHWNHQTVPNRSPLPGYGFGGGHPSAAGAPPPPYYSQQPIPGHPPPHVGPYPPGAHYPPNYGYFGPNAGTGSPNGAFMIQNLLQHRPPAPEDVPHPTPGTPIPASTAPSTTATGAVTAANTPSTVASGGGPPAATPPAPPPPRELRAATNDTFTTY